MKSKNLNLYVLEFSFSDSIIQSYYSSKSVALDAYEKKKLSKSLNYIALVAYVNIDGVFVFESRKLLKLS